MKHLLCIGFLGITVLIACGQKATTTTVDNSTTTTNNEEKKDTMGTFEITKTDAEWKEELTPQQYNILRLKGTEAPFSGKYYYENDEGIYCCAACNNPLFKSDTKFDAGCGWPSFYMPINKDAVKENRDVSHGMVRTEVVCGKCGGHLGHVFEDAPEQPTGLRYCINSLSIDLDKKEE